MCNAYYCLGCKNTVDNSKKGMEKLVDNHNRIFMPKLNVYSNIIVDVERLGKNKASLNNEVNDISHSANCNSCSNNITGIRFICLICRPGFCFNMCDYCHRCMDIFLNSSHESHSNTAIANLEIDKHDIKSHKYLRLWYSSGSNLDY